jgi:RHH-type proline utilization regulon transcriptional repressor/proline dehydrogenase/delta 1-pyrroline-5-carboxylate dehydrogenase
MNRWDAESWERYTDRAIRLATTWLASALETTTKTEKKCAQQVQAVVDDQALKFFTVTLCDRLFRATSSGQAAHYYRGILEEQGVPRALPFADQMLLRLGGWASYVGPQWVVPAMMQRLKQDAATVVWLDEKAVRQSQALTSKELGFQHQYNRLGEAVLGEAEATRRLSQVLQLLAEPEVTMVSVKISNLYSQVSALAFESTVTEVQNRLRHIYRAALQASPAKFVNLDMEEYRDVDLTVEVFKRTLAEPEFKNLTAGIVLQAYLPDAFAVQQDLTAWALQRVAQGGTPIRVRLVKGANLAMERVEAELHDWPLAPYRSKAEVDANYKRMLAWGACPEHLQAVRLGVASHNLLDLAFAEVLRQEWQLGPGISFEMLAGMAPAQARQVQQTTQAVALYTPLVTEGDFGVAIAYLLRRLEENTAPGNFLRELFSLTPTSPAWQRQVECFKQACRTAQVESVTTYRTQNRLIEPQAWSLSAPFTPASDTDWTRVANRQWIKQELQKKLPEEAVPSSVSEVELALGKAEAAVDQLGDEALRASLCRAPLLLEKRRGALIALMVREGKKTVAEADVEVSEAIDFANYYARAFDDKPQWQGASRRPLGVVVVASPWNFPLAIPFGGVVAALRTGNAVILKPAPEVRRCGQAICQVLWDVGIPRELLQWLPAPDDDVGKKLITDERVKAVILTGSSATAEMFLTWRPDLKLLAETSGKNAIVVTPSADREQAVKDIVKSAFGHAGQKCSACSLLVLVGEVGCDQHFLAQLKDAAASLKVGKPESLDTFIPPLMQAPAGDLLRGLIQLDEGESWLLAPQCLDATQHLWSPGIRTGVTSKSWFAQAECFGPILGVVTVRTLADALKWVNASRFGLTGGLQSLDEREIGIYLDEVEVGNVYVNRPITGAIVHRQPFGGHKLSVYGPGAKAGGPWALAALCHWENEPNPDWKPESLRQAVEKFETPQEQANLLCEANVYRRLPRPEQCVFVRFAADAKLEECHRLLDCVVAMTHVWVVSIDPSLDPYLIERVAQDAAFCEVQTEDDFASSRIWLWSRIRHVGTVSNRVRAAAQFASATIFEGPVTSCIGLEMHSFYLEQSISFAWHRYGQPWPQPQARATRELWAKAGLIRTL